MADFSSEKSEMSSVSEASALVRRVAVPHDTYVKALIRRAAWRLHWEFSRTKDIWYKDARRIDSAEMDRLRDEAARAEARLAIRNLLALRSRLAAVDPNFHGPTIAALDDVLRRMGCEVGAVDFREE